MAELLCWTQPGVSPRYVEGDIVSACNQRRIRCMHADEICHPWKAGFTSDGLRPFGIAEQYLIRTTQYRFTRVSPTEVVRRDLATLAEETVDSTPRLLDGKVQHMHVEQEVAFRKRNPNRVLFGAPDREVWYGGRRTVTDAVMTLAWSDIERMTPLREVNFRSWPFTRDDKFKFVPLLVNDFSEARRSAYEAEERSPDPDNPVIIRKRNFGVDLDTALSIPNRAKARNAAVEYDGRDEGLKQRADIVVTR